MLLRTLADPREFLAMARKMDAEILVLRSTTVIPVFKGTAVVWVPALVLRYSFRFTEDGTQHRWIAGSRAGLRGVARRVARRPAQRAVRARRAGGTCVALLRSRARGRMP
jgi:hypothetical protein